LVLGIIASTYAQVVEIVAPATVPEHSLVQVQTSESGVDYAWTVLGPRGEEQVAVFGRQAVFTGPPGRYAILQAWTTTTGEKRQAFTFTTILAGDDRENPDPFPRPPPEPIIEKGPRWVVIVEETADRQSLSPGQLSMITSKTLDQYCQQNGHRLRIYDQDSKGPTGSASTVLAPYLERLRADGVSLPAVVILDAADNATIYTGPLPDDTDAMIEILQQKGG
jgi:hypothetical protein